jgi:hypothetical protein
MLKMTMTMVAVDNYSQRRLRTMGSGSGGGGVMAEIEGDVWMQRRWPAVAGGGMGGGRAAAESILVSVFFFVRPASRSSRVSLTIG